MVFLLSLIGLVLLVVAIGSFIIPAKSVIGQKLPGSIPAKVVLLFLGLILLFSSQFLLKVRPGHQYYVVSPFGAKTVFIESGWKVITPFSIVQEWEKYLDIKTVAQGESAEGIEGVLSPINVRFTDQVTGTLQAAMRVELPPDAPSFISLVETYKHPKNLANNTLAPVLREQAYNVAQMFRAEAYVSGSAQEFRATLDDALKNGTFVVDRREDRDTVYEEFDADVKVLNRNRAIKEIRTTYKVEKRLDKNGVPIREEHDITKNNLIIAQVIVEGLQMEAKFRQKLEQQRDISAEKSIEAQKIETAKIAQQRILAEGERDKAAERVAQEKAQVSKLIAIETQVKEEESKRQLAAIALETERLVASKKKVAADAKRYEILQADEISAEKKYIIDKETEQIKYLSTAMEKANWPNYYAPGGTSGKGGTPLDQMVNLMTMQMAKSLEGKGN